jgi:hypothetical protein
MIPDVHPGFAMQEAANGGRRLGTMSMSAADFTVLYTQPNNRETFDAVTTVFFIDTAPNLIRYIDPTQPQTKWALDQRRSTIVAFR